MTSWKRICCAVDFSDASLLALDESAYLARTLGAELVLLHVHVDSESGWGSEGLPLRDAEALLVSWRRQAEFLADRAVRMAMVEGKPHDEIVRFATGGQFDLIVLGTYGRRGFKESVLGSGAEHVVRLARCPVLVVRHRRRESVLAEPEGPAGEEGAGVTAGPSSGGDGEPRS